MNWFTSALFGFLAVIATVGEGVAQDADVPAFSAAGELIFPTGYREWVFIGSGLGMEYGPNVQPEAFENVYVPREVYKAFLQSGKWPERTILMMEGRAPETHQLLANTGTVQGKAQGIEAAVKDTARFPDTGWGYFAFGVANAPRAVAQRLPPARFDCYSCHSQNTAVENTFVQYYPELLEAAKKFGTVKSTYDPTRKF